MKARYIKSDGTEKVRNNAKCPNYEQLTSFVGGPLERFPLMVRPPGGKVGSAAK